MNNAVYHLLIRNVVRWRWRLGLIAFLVCGSVSIGVLYGGMLQKAQYESLDQVSSLNLPYDIMVVLAKNQAPRTHFDSLGMYQFKPQGTNVGRGRFPDYPILVEGSENAVAITLQTPFGLWEVWGVEPNGALLQSKEQVITGDWPNEVGEIWIPKSFHLTSGLQIGDEFSVIYVDPFGAKKNYQFKVCGIGENGYDLEKPFISMQTVLQISGLTKPNRQLLKVPTLQYLINWSVLSTRMNEMFPGGQYFYKAMPQLQWQILMSKILNPGQWVLLLVFVFMAVSVLTISLMTFLERKQELAVLKTIGVSNTQLSLVLILELFLSGLIGFLIGAVAVQFISWLKPNLFETLNSSIPKLLGSNAGLTLLFFMMAVLYPLLLARVATVNQLLYSREIPLIVNRYDHILSPPADWIQQMQEEKVCILKMTVVDGKSLAMILRNPGDHVKQGEAVAFMNSLAGFHYQEWLSPCDGVVLSFESNNGKYVIQPDDPNAAFRAQGGVIQGQKVLSLTRKEN